eukprot:4462480-Pleurochrysis_carterae.AAC.1
MKYLLYGFSGMHLLRPPSTAGRGTARRRRRCLLKLRCTFALDFINFRCCFDMKNDASSKGSGLRIFMLRGKHNPDGAAQYE